MKNFLTKKKDKETLVLVRYRNYRYPGCTTRTSVPFATQNLYISWVLQTRYCEMVEANRPCWRGVNIRRNEIKEIYTNPCAPCARASLKRRVKRRILYISWVLQAKVWEMVEANHPYWRGVNIRRERNKGILQLNPRAPCAREGMREGYIYVKWGCTT